MLLCVFSSFICTHVLADFRIHETYHMVPRVFYFFCHSTFYLFGCVYHVDGRFGVGRDWRPESCSFTVTWQTWWCTRTSTSSRCSPTLSTTWRWARYVREYCTPLLTDHNLDHLQKILHLPYLTTRTDRLDHLYPSTRAVDPLSAVLIVVQDLYINK